MKNVAAAALIALLALACGAEPQPTSTREAVPFIGAPITEVDEPTIDVADDPATMMQPPDRLTFARDIQPVLDAHCVSCHSGTDGNNRDLIDLRPGRSFASLFGSASAPATRVCRDENGTEETIRVVDPEHPEASVLWRKLAAIEAPFEPGSPVMQQSCGTYAMPPFPGLIALSPEAFDTVDTWLRQGAAVEPEAAR